MKVYVLTHKHYNSKTIYVAGVFPSVESYEKKRDDSWNGKCHWRLSQDTIGRAGLDFKTWFLYLDDDKNDQWYICLKGFEVES